MKKNVLKLNIVAALFLQVVTMISGFIIPKIMLSYFGSSVNGLVSSINQFLNYITLLEGGVGSVIMSILYRPLYEKDQKRVSKIINTTSKFFRVIGTIYIGYVVLLSIIYPKYIASDFSKEFIITLIWVLACNTFFQYFLSITYRLLLNADKKVAFVSFVQAFAVILNIICVVVFTIKFRNIVITKAISAAVFLIQPILYRIYVKKEYKIDSEDGIDEFTQSHRWDGLGINTAYFIHSNTDIMILTIFTSLTDVSIYAIYLLIVNALKNLIGSISTALTPSFGSVLASGNSKQANEFFDAYELIVCLITTICFTCGMILVTPFVDVYTMNIHDANYHQVLFGILLMISEMIYCYRDPYVSASYAAGHIKQVSKYAYVEAGINIVLSVILVRRFGLIGVAIGTCISMAYRMLMQVNYLKSNILNRPWHIFAKLLLINIISAVISTVVSFKFIDLHVLNYFQWLIVAVKVFLIVVSSEILLLFLFDRKDLSLLLDKLREKEKNK